MKARYDLGLTMLVGHNRGGEKVAHAANQSLGNRDVHIAGQVLVAPTNFFQTASPLTPTLTILPGCDGDVADLQGVDYSDGAIRYGTRQALSTAAYLPGANHNYFNTEWTPDAPTGMDDGEWTECAAEQRLSPAREH
ncbi:hypothetical protein [Luteococcus sediminum]